MPVTIEEGFAEFTYLKPIGLSAKTELQTSTVYMGDIDGFILGDRDGKKTGIVRTKGGQAYPIGEVEYYELLDAWKGEKG